MTDVANVLAVSGERIDYLYLREWSVRLGVLTYWSRLSMARTFDRAHLSDMYDCAAVIAMPSRRY